MTAGSAAIVATASGGLLALAILLPALGVLLSFLIGGRRAEWIALGLMPVELAVAIVIAALVWRSGQPLVYTLAGYAPPLGIALRADGFSAVMLVTAGLIAPAAGLFARTNFATPQGAAERRAPLVFWTLLQGVQAGLSLLFLGGDLFNLYVGLELLTFAAVPLVCLDGRPETIAAALRYLLFALFGSVFYLLGVALLYGAYGTLDIVLLSERIRAQPAVWLAAGLMTAGLLAKTALFPLHLWLPQAHANAPAPASAMLSSLVVKGSFFLVVRLWFDVLAPLPVVIPGVILAGLGSAAILFGSVLALRQERLKLLIAYSTVAQIGYLFLMFPLGPRAMGGGRFRRRNHAGSVARVRQGGDVPVRGPRRRIPWPRPHRRPRRRRSRDASDVPRPGSRRAVAHGAAAKRRLRRQVAPDEGLDRGRPMGVGGCHGGRRAAGGRISLPGARPRAFWRDSRTRKGARAQPRERRAGACSCGAAARLRAAIVLRLPADRPTGRGPRAAMTGLAAQFGPGLLALSLATPLAVLALFLVPGQRALARAITPLAALPALAAAILAIGGAPFGVELPALRVSLWLDQGGALLLLAAALVWLIVSIVAFQRPLAAIADRGDDKRGQGRPNGDRFAVAWLLTMAGSFGVFIAADLLTFYLVYALVSVPAYYLVAHDEDAASRRAGGVYLAFALIGEAVLLLAFVMLAAGEPGGSVQIRDVVAALPASPWRDAALALIILGFGMKIALVPLHGWMPLAYTAAPIPAAAVLSGAAVKAGVIGLIRFLPFGAALPYWGEALAWLGFVSAFFGVAIGVTQRNPKTTLAYSSVSQMGVIAAALGMGLAGADKAALADAAFYAANHVLVKAALFLTIGVVGARGGRARSAALIVGAVLGLSLAGLPLTGGALAKLAVKGPFGDGAAGVAAALSAAGSAALMLCFVMRLARSPADEGGASPERLGSWLALALAALVVPWLMFPVVGSTAEAFEPAKLVSALWPMLVGAALAAGVWTVRDRLPRIPAGDLIVAEEAAFRASLSLGPMFERADRGLREWPAAGLALLMIALALAAAGYASR